MKNFARITLMALISTSTLASGPLTSQKLAGTYKIKTVSSDYAKTYHCPEELEITVNETEVILLGTKGVPAYEGFFGKNEGCEQGEGDISLVGGRISCTKFHKRSATDSLTSPLTIVGFIRDKTKVAISRDNKTLTYKHTNVSIPAGILGVSDNEEFDCTYERTNN